MVNATHMTKIFPNKRMNDFLSNQDTKDFINECLKNGNPRFLNVQKRSDLIISRQKSGTWMHRVLALKFAAWLSPAFELWVYRTIDEILYGFSHEQDNSIRRSVQLQFEIAELEKKPDKSGDDLERYIRLQNDLLYERSKRAGLTRSRYREVYKNMKEQLMVV